MSEQAQDIAEAQRVFEELSVRALVDTLDEQLPLKAEVLESEGQLTSSERSYRLTCDEIYSDIELSITFQSHKESQSSDGPRSVMGPYYCLRVSRSLYDDVDPEKIIARKEYTVLIDEQKGSIDTIDTDEYVVSESGAIVRPMEPEPLQPWETVELPSAHLDDVQALVGRID